MSGVRLIGSAADFRADGRPLMVVDVDEVILHFVAPLAAYVARFGYRLEPRSFAITGNVVREGGGQAIAGELVKELIDCFFRDEVENQPAVEGAVAALATLRATCDIVVLTNVPARQAERRAAHLSRLGLTCPMIANEGSKGGPIADLAAAARSVGGDALEVVFVDDGPNHLAAARGTVERLRLVHFVADPAWFAMAPQVGGTWLRTRDWDEVTRTVSTLVG